MQTQQFSVMTAERIFDFLACFVVVFGCGARKCKLTVIYFKYLLRIFPFRAR